MFLLLYTRKIEHIMLYVEIIFIFHFCQTSNIYISLKQYLLKFVVPCRTFAINDSPPTNKIWAALLRRSRLCPASSILSQCLASRFFSVFLIFLLLCGFQDRACCVVLDNCFLRVCTQNPTALTMSYLYVYRLLSRALPIASNRFVTILRHLMLRMRLRKRL